MSVFCFVALAVGVICNSVSIIVILFRLRSLSRSSRVSVRDLVATNRLNFFRESIVPYSSFSESVSRLSGQSKLD